MPGVYAPDERLPHSCMCCMRNVYAFRNDLECKMVHCVYSDGPQIWKGGRLESCKLRYIEGAPSEKAPAAEKTAKTGEVILNHCPNCHIVTANDNGWHRRGEHDDTRICEICGSEMKCYKPWLSPWWLANEAKLHDEWMEKNMIVVTDIEWDADEDDGIPWRSDADQFPKKVLIPRDRIIHDGEEPLSDEELADRVIKYLEDKYEFCINCCCIESGD